MPLPRNPRRLEDDINNEPDLYAITNLYPVPLGVAVPNATVQPQAPVVVSNDQVQQQQQQQLQLQQQQQQQQLQQQQVFMAAAQPIQQPTFLAPGMQSFAPAGMIAGYPQPQFFFAAAPTTAYATAAPQFITTYPGAAVGSYPMMAAAAPAQFAPATTTTPMFSHPFIFANPAPSPVAAATTPTFINTNNLGQPVFNFAPGVIATTPTAAHPTATTTSS
jgi:hypothetical protein